MASMLSHPTATKLQLREQSRVARSPALEAGHVELSAEVLEAFSDIAARDYAQAALDEFSGDGVRDIDWSGLAGLDVPALLPGTALRERGLRIARAHPKLYATCGIEPHVDDMDGLSVALVLHSDGFRFRQGGRSMRLAAGDWFVFDDTIPHEVVEDESATTLLVLTAPVRRSANG